MSDGNTLLISGLQAKRSETAGRMVDLRRELDKLKADLVHVDSVLRLYGLEPSEIPTKGRMPKRSTYFGRNELSRRCRDMLREKGSIRADDVTVRATREKGLDPESDRKLRADFTRRILVSLHDLMKAGTVEKVGHGRRGKVESASRTSGRFGAVGARKFPVIMPSKGRVRPRHGGARLDGH